jgi:hypothetical protein
MRCILNGRDLRLTRPRSLVASHLRKIQIEVKLDDERPALLPDQWSGPGDKNPWRSLIQTEAASWTIDNTTILDVHTTATAQHRSFR